MLETWTSALRERIFARWDCDADTRASNMADAFLLSAPHTLASHALL
jgi:hypothetical protein